MEKIHKATDFYINGKLIEIRQLHSREQFARENSVSNLGDRGFITLGEFCTRPNEPLSDLCDEESNGFSTVFIAITEEDNFIEPIGLTLYSRDEVTQSYEMATLIKPQYQYTCLPLELSRVLVEDARTNGIKTVYTTDSSDDLEMRKLADKLNMSVRMDKAYRRLRYSLQTDKHPWVVEV